MVRIISTKKTNAILLAFILLSGSITSIFSSLIIGIAQAESEYYGINNNHRDDDFLKKIDCVNSNTNINSLNSGSIDTSSEPIATNNLEDLPTEKGLQASVIENNKRNNGYDSDNYFDCINNNNNQRQGGIGPQGPPGQRGPQGIQGPPGSIDKSNAYVVWQDYTSGQNAEIFFRASHLSGTPINLSNSLEHSQTPQILSEGNNVYVVWVDAISVENYDVFFSKSNDNGLTFSSPINLSNNAGISNAPQLAISDDNVYVTWEDNTSGNFEILFSSSNNNGQIFSTPINLSSNSGISGSPQITSEGDNVYVVWQDTTTSNRETDIFFSRSNDNGQTFSTPINLSNNIVESNEPKIASEGDNVYVVWYDDTPNNQPDIFFSKSNDNGLTFNSPKNLSSNERHSSAPQITSEGDNVYVVWQDRTTNNANDDIFFSKSNDNGQTFSPPINLSNNAGISQEPQVSTEGNNVYVVWFDNTLGNYDIFFTQSNDNGLTFSNPINLSDNIGDSSNVQIANEGDNVYVVWHDRTPGNYDIFYITNNQDFGTFGNTINISNNAGDSFNPQISTSTTTAIS